MNPYKVLDISNSASKKEIKKAYRKKAKKYHPDRHDGPDAQEKFKRIKRAYEELTTSKERKVFSSQNNDDIFNSFFGGKKKTVTKTLKLSLKDVINRRKINLKINGNKLSFRIPGNIKDGKKLKFKGKGKNGGDLYIKVNIKDNKHFDIEDNNLIYYKNIDYLEALFGTKFKVPNLKKNKKDYLIEVNQNLHPSDLEYRIKNEGIGNGDIIVKCKLVNVNLSDKKINKLKEKITWKKS